VGVGGRVVLIGRSGGWVSVVVVVPELGAVVRVLRLLAGTSRWSGGRRERDWRLPAWA
jgi:hypothetical protein